MTVRQLVDLLKKSDDHLKGAKVLAERLDEKKKAGQLAPGEEDEWYNAIHANVKAAEEVRREIDALSLLLG